MNKEDILKRLSHVLPSNDNLIEVESLDNADYINRRIANSERWGNEVDSSRWANEQRRMNNYENHNFGFIHQTPKENILSSQIICY